VIKECQREKTIDQDHHRRRDSFSFSRLYERSENEEDERLKLKLSKTQDSLMMVESKLHESQSQVKRLQDENSSLTTENSDLKSQLQILAGLVASLETQLESYKNNIPMDTSENNQIRIIQLESAQAELREARDEIRALRNELDRYRSDASFNRNNDSVFESLSEPLSPSQPTNRKLIPLSPYSSSKLSSPSSSVFRRDVRSIEATSFHIPDSPTTQRLKERLQAVTDKFQKIKMSGK